ncbi:hypothetical protein K9M47_03095 [Candidatus Gracilibacteria bacterium]|nr:hypothetical protein [Candidatus Gracilibacteria bacterium]
MIYNGSSTNQDIVSDTLFEASANLNSYPIADITRNSNTALDTAVSLILFADEKWDFDSTNATDFPIGTTDILSGQNDYEFDDDFLVIKAIEVQDSNGNWKKLKPIDNLTLEEQEAMSTLTENTGTPEYYDKVGGSFFLIPTPNYNRRLVEETEAGLKVYFQRNIDYFTTSDTTKEPGFAKHLHKYIPLYNAYVYACAKELPKANKLEKRLEFYEGNRLRGGNVDGAFISHYRKRERDNQQQITSEDISFI